MKKIDKAIMLLRTIPEEKLDTVIDFLIAFSVPVKHPQSKTSDIIDLSEKLIDDRED